ncbi:MAG TPA: lipase family protein [Acidimicrobiales bacterium]|nr:lipase family protein [Acidimicrobiales bacterium]
MLRNRVARTVGAVAVALGLVVTAAAAPALSAAPPIPEDDPFFAAPADLAALAPGQVVRSRPVTIKAFELPVPADAWQLVYRTSDRLGRPTVTGTTVIVPRTPWRGRGPRPLVSYQTAEDGVSTRCAPSYALTAGVAGGFTGSYSEAPVLLGPLSLGWALSVPDYEGMASQFLVADVAAKAVLDGVRAARSFAPAALASSPVALWGYSGGAFASANAAQLQASYAPELPMRGVALGGLLGSVRATIDAFDGSIAGSAVPMGVHGLARSYPELDLPQYLNDLGRDLYAATAADCLFDAAARRPFLRVSQITRVPQPFDVPAVAAMLRANSPQFRPGAPTAPVYEYHTLLDEFAPIGPARATLRNYCAAGTPVQHATKLLGEHLTEIVAGIPGALAFLSARFAGRAPVDGCAGLRR